ncbi:MAG: uroporphyrinogen-III synthase [Magnetospirillum gryphiswaldense]|nr:uroporphyrinogen-III synthase [Magnetospirillum gryphiswaldense]
MRTALVTRPRDDAGPLAALLEGRGLAVMVEPLLDIVPVDGVEVPTGGVQGILATSANGVRSLAAVLADRSLPVWAVGDASARVAREMGYGRVESAGGDVDDLSALVAARCKPEDGAFLHAAGSVTAGDLSGQLTAAGFEVRRLVLYQAHTAEALSDELIAALDRGGVDLALFFSPRTAATFARLVAAAGKGEALSGVTAYALSPAVQRELSVLSWAAIRVARTPTQAALLAALDHDLQREEPMSDSEKPNTEQENGESASPPPSPAVETGDEQDKATPKKPFPWLTVVLAVVILAFIGGGVATYEQWKGLVQPPKSSPVPVAPPSVSNTTPAPAFRPATESETLKVELAALRDRLAQLENRPQAEADSGRLDKAEAAITALQAQPQVPAKLVGEVEDLGKQLAELKRTSADAAAVLRMADRLEKIEAELRDIQAKRSSAVAVLLAVGQLREALARAMPFDAELRALLALAGNDPEVVTQTQPLKARAELGIPTRTTLVTRFHRLAPDLVRAQVLPADQSWWRQTLDRLAALVVVRREDGDAAGSGTAAIVARIETRLAEDDLEHAADEAAGLKDAAAEIVAPWLADARARLVADKAASALTAHVVAQVGARP